MGWRGLELRAVQPNAVQDRGQLAGDRHLRLAAADPPGQAQAQSRSAQSLRTRVISAFAASNSRLRAVRSPDFEMRPPKSTSPDW